MPIDIDGYAVLGAIARERQAFAAIRNEVSRTARALVVRQLKEKSLSLADLRTIAAAVGQEVFELILDPMSDAETGALLAKVDAAAAAATPALQRKRLSALAGGAAAAEPGPTPAAKPARPDTVERAINSRAMTAKKKKKAKPSK